MKKVIQGKLRLFGHICRMKLITIQHSALIWSKLKFTHKIALMLEKTDGSNMESHTEYDVTTLWNGMEAACTN